jgi:GNAT superfamily N-acetyltransferase
MAIRIAPPQDASDREWLGALWREEWGGETMVSRGHVYSLADMDALIAWSGQARVGLATYLVSGAGCELMSLNAVAEGQGAGTALLAAVEEEARRRGCARVWLITSNDNLDALRFYQRQGYRLCAVYPGAIDEARKLKPTIPLTGYFGIPIRDEVELEKRV